MDMGDTIGELSTVRMLVTRVFFGFIVSQTQVSVSVVFKLNRIAASYWLH